MTTEEQQLVAQRLRERAVFTREAGHNDDADLDVEAADTITRLVKERDEARALNNRYAWERDKAREERDSAERRSEAHWKSLAAGAKPTMGATASEARIAELQEALKPFAKAADVKLCGEWRDDERFGHTDITFHLTFGDLRAARRALEASK